MITESRLARWLELFNRATVVGVPDARSDSTPEPIVDVCVELASMVVGGVAWLVDHAPDAVRLVVPVHEQPFDRAQYVARMTDHPLVRHQLTSADEHTHRLAEVTGSGIDAAAADLLVRARADGLTDFVLLPLLPRPGWQHRWLILCSAAPLEPEFVQLCERLRGAIRMIDCRSDWPIARLDDVPADVPERAPTERLSDRLSDREAVVLDLLGTGLTAVAIGHQLGISPFTVRKHLERVYTKLGVHDRLGAVLTARRLGLLTDLSG